MKISYEKITEINNVGGLWKIKNPSESKFSYALQKIGTQIQKILEKENNRLQEKLVDIATDTCSIDKDKNIIKDANKELVYSKEGIKKRNELQREAIEKHNSYLGQKEFEIEPYYAVDIPDNLTEYEKEVFAGVIIKP